jgi:hypothetical protein
MTKIYLDACCLNRLTDDQAQQRIHEEAEAVELILRHMRYGEVQWISSEALTNEINRNPNLERRLGNAALLNLQNRPLKWIRRLPAVPRTSRLRAMEPLTPWHLACAEAAQVDVLVTTDDGFVRKASRRNGNPGVV